MGFSPLKWGLEWENPIKKKKEEEINDWAMMAQPEKTLVFFSLPSHLQPDDALSLCYHGFQRALWQAAVLSSPSSSLLSLPLPGSFSLSL